MSRYRLLLAKWLLLINNLCLARPDLAVASTVHLSLVNGCVICCHWLTWIRHTRLGLSHRLHSIVESRHIPLLVRALVHETARLYLPYRCSTASFFRVRLLLSILIGLHLSGVLQVHGLILKEVLLRIFQLLLLLGKHGQHVPLRAAHCIA